ncbi:MAG: desulfoferrodoxin FeS4 iron-binding domain-containing protein [Nanoarchaeota archaeon]|nr:desulfoferrodoxin FeS4 iron-binding domain-containing protein [Nanoarchaeota archaeon]
MGKKNEIYKCSVCGQMIEILEGTQSKVVCCGKEMIVQEAKSQDTSLEKHVPFLEENEKGVLVKIGEKEMHPMTDAHYILFIEVITKDKVLRANLKPTDLPQAQFSVKKKDIIEVREFCNLHGLWNN